MLRPYGTPLDCEDVGWEHHWLPVTDRGPRAVGQVCATCDMLRIPSSQESRIKMLAENIAFIARVALSEQETPR